MHRRELFQKEMHRREMPQREMHRRELSQKEMHTRELPQREGGKKMLFGNFMWIINGNQNVGRFIQAKKKPLPDSGKLARVAKAEFRNMRMQFNFVFAVAIWKCIIHIIAEVSSAEVTFEWFFDGF